MFSVFANLDTNCFFPGGLRNQDSTVDNKFCYYINCSGIASGSKSRKMVSHVWIKMVSTQCDIIFYQSAHRVCHVIMLNGPSRVQIDISLVRCAHS